MSKFDDALTFAVKAHAGMTRKRDKIPFILHPMEVATIAATMTNDEDVLSAALLHDVVEDTPMTLDEVEKAFGSRVAALVASETENKRPELPSSETWKVRKEESLEVLRTTTDRGVQILWLADKLANMRSFARIHEHEGDAMWHGFNQKDPREQKWYFESVLRTLECLSETPAWREYDKLMELVFGEVE